MGPGVWDQALDDRDRVRAQLLNHPEDALKEAEGARWKLPEIEAAPVEGS